MFEKKRFERKIYLFVFTAGILATIIFMCFSSYSDVKRKKAEMYHLLEIYSVRAEALFDGLFHKTDILESVIIMNRGEMEPETFDELADALMDGSGVRCIQCLPGGTVTYCYPLEGNESVIGNNIFEQPKRREDAMLALRTRQIALSGPYALTQGGLGLVARNPIFLNDDDGSEIFWGFSVVVLDLPDALKPLALGEMKNNGYDYQMDCVVNGEEVVIDRSVPENSDESALFEKRLSGREGTDYIGVEINVPNHVWHLKTVPADGWIDRGALALNGFIGFSFTVLLTAIIFLLEKQGRQMEQYATTDELTGLFNRRRLREYMDIRCRDEKVGFAIFYLDLNRFKAINDTMGHACGDAVLKEAGQRIKAAIGKEGSVYRIGGDEFIAIMEVEVSEANCLEKCIQIKKKLAEPFAYEAHPVEIGASVGFAMFPDEGKTFDELLRLADGKMYEEKRDI